MTEEGKEPLQGGEKKNKCGAKKRQYPYTPCEQPAGFGTNHPGYGACKFHGGNLPNHAVAAERNRLEDQARVILGRSELEPVHDPLGELQKLAAEVVAFKNILGDKVEELQGWTYEDLTETEQMRAVLMAYERALDRCEKTLSSIVRLNIEERLARLSQAQAAIMVALFEAVFEARELGMSREQVATAKSIVAREIPRVTSSSAA